MINVVEMPQGTYPYQVAAAQADADLAVAQYIAGLEDTTEAGVAARVLEALGKNDDVNGKAKNGFLDVALVPIWLTAHRTRELIVASPQIMSAKALTGLAAMISAAPTTLVLVCDNGGSARVMQHLSPWAPTRIPDRSPKYTPLPVKPAHESNCQALTPETSWSDRDLVLPRVEPGLFRFTCRKYLDPDHFAVVDIAYVTAFRMARTRLTDVPDEQSTRDLLTALLCDAQDVNHAVTVIRAIQCAYLDAGWMLRVDLDNLLSILTTDRVPAPSVAHWRLLRSYRDPARAASVALYLGGLTIAQIGQVTISAVAAAHQTGDYTILGLTQHIEALPYIRAQLLARAAEGAKGPDRFIGGDDRRPYINVRHARDDLGLLMGEGRIMSEETANSRWQTRLGFELKDVR